MANEQWHVVYRERAKVNRWRQWGRGECKKGIWATAGSFARPRSFGAPIRQCPCPMGHSQKN